MRRLSVSARGAVDDAWVDARRQARALDRILVAAGPRRSAIARAAAELSLSTRQVYNLLGRYQPEQTVSALLAGSGRPRVKRLTAAVEAIIATTLRERWLVLEAPPLAPIVDEIRARCEEEGERPPSYGAVKVRIPGLFGPIEIAKGRSANPSHVHRLKARPGYIHAPYPLAVCQIDHTPSDIQFVDVIDRLGVFIGRAYLTLLVDVFSRAVLGFCLTLEKPSSLSVALCLAHALCPKDIFMRERGLEHEWPMHGRPERLVVDSAKEFRGEAFARGCEEYRIAVKRRSRGTVHRGGVVERLLGKLNAVIATLFGTTGRSVSSRDGYPSERRACLTFADLERCLTLAIVEHNAHQNRKSLKVPLDQWRAHAGKLKRHNDDPHQVLLAFLPGGGRRLTAQGVSLFALDYWAAWLGELVPQRDRLGKLQVRYDPRDLSHIYLRHPHRGEFRPVPRRDGVATPITLWEHRRDRKERRSAVTATAKVKLRREIAAVAENAKLRSSPRPGATPARTNSHKAALRSAARAAHAALSPKPYQAMAPEPAEAAEHPLRTKKPLSVQDW
jgi:putative transposase